MIINEKGLFLLSLSENIDVQKFNFRSYWSVAFATNYIGSLNAH